MVFRQPNGTQWPQTKTPHHQAQHPQYQKSPQLWQNWKTSTISQESPTFAQLKLKLKITSIGFGCQGFITAESGWLHVRRRGIGVGRRVRGSATCRASLPPASGLLDGREGSSDGALALRCGLLASGLGLGVEIRTSRVSGLGLGVRIQCWWG